MSVANGRWCPNCKNKTETKLLKWLKEKFDVIPQATFEWAICESTKHNYIYDFFLPQLNLIIELDGDQHFRQVSNWNPPESTQERDIDKMLLALQNDVHVIRIYQEDVYYDKELWETQLSNLIKTRQHALDFVKTKKQMVVDTYEMYAQKCSLFM